MREASGSPEVVEAVAFVSRGVLFEDGIASDPKSDDWSVIYSASPALQSVRTIGYYFITGEQHLNQQENRADYRRFSCYTLVQWLL
jgi:hypothetical protein